MKILILLLFSFSVHAFDPDQSLSKCGEYQAFATISCQGADSCYLHVGDSKQSKLIIYLIPSTKNISYFNGQDIMMNIEVVGLKDSKKARPLSTPVQQLSAIKKAGLKLVRTKPCK